MLASYAEELMLGKEYAGQPAAMALATELVQAAVDADGRRDNIKAHMSAVAYSLGVHSASASGWPHHRIPTGR